MIPNNIEDALEHCLDQIISDGLSLEACLAQYPQFADELRPLLYTVAMLHAETPADATAQQIQSIEQRILQAIPARKTAPVIFSFYQRTRTLRLAAATILVLILATIIYALAQDDTSSDGILGTAGNRPAAEILPITVTFTGIVFEQEAEIFMMDGVRLIFADSIKSPSHQQLIKIEGNLLDDGTVEVTAWQNGDTSELMPYSNICEEQPCNPILYLLMDHYDLPYSNLEQYVLDGLTVGELARLLALADISGDPLNTLVQRYHDGASWEDLAKSLDDPVPVHLEARATAS